MHVATGIRRLAILDTRKGHEKGAIGEHKMQNALPIMLSLIPSSSTLSRSKSFLVTVFGVMSGLKILF